jgi:hypothetical protein
MAADDIAVQFETHSRESWNWFEDVLSYDNAVLPNAMFVAASATGEERYLDIAKLSSRFLLDNIFNGEHFSFVGCKGWYRRGQNKANFDQQPIEVASTIMMLEAAYKATSDSSLLKLQKKAFDWFLGQNDIHIPVYDFRTKGCYDGLQRGGVNLNQGAESMVCFLLSLLLIVESYSTKRKRENEIPLFAREHRTIIKEKIPVKSVAPAKKPAKPTPEKV